MDRNRFIVTLPNDTLGGAEYFLKNISTHLSSKEAMSGEVIFMKKKNTGAWEDLSDRVSLKYGKHSRELFGAFSTAWRIIKSSKKNSSLVLSSHAHLNGLNCFLRRLGLLKCKYLVIRESNAVFDRHKGFKLMMVKFFHRFAYQSSDLIICQTEYMKQRLIEGTVHAKKWNIKVIPNPVPFEMLKSKAEHITKAEMEIFGDYIVAAGRLIPIKGFNYLLEAFSGLEDKSLKLVILGEGQQRSSLELLAKELNVADRVILPGFVDNPMPYFKYATACVVSSISEGFPNVLLQMMTLNTNVISTQCAGGIEDIPGIEHCAIEHTEELKLAIEKCLSQNNFEELRLLFDQYLDARSLSNFSSQMFKYLDTDQ